MKKFALIVLFLFVFGGLCACGSKSKDDEIFSTTAPPPSEFTTKIRVTDVSNDSGDLYDVDVIGLLWSGMNESLSRRGMLWTPDSANPPLTLEAHVVKYRKGSLAYRMVPYYGTTVLKATCELKQDGRVIASAESSETISLGNDGLTFGAWKKIFSRVSEELVRKVTGKM